MTEPRLARNQTPAEQPAARPLKSRPAEDQDPRILVHYYHKMKWQRVFPLKVEWQTEPGFRPGSSLPPVVIRPIIPGAVVTPVEQTLDATASSPVAVFYVTPLALGTIPAAHVDVLAPEGPPTQITLPMKSVRQRLTKILLLLTFLVPAFLLYALKYGKLEGEIREKLPRNAVRKPPGRDNRQSPALERMIKGQPGQVLAFWIKQETPPIPYVTDNVAEGLGAAYDFLYVMNQGDPLHFYVGLTLLVLTGTSWLAHLSARGRRRSPPIHLTRRPVEQPAADSRPELPERADDVMDITLIESTGKVPPEPIT